MNSLFIIKLMYFFIRSLERSQKEYLRIISDQVEIWIAKNCNMQKRINRNACMKRPREHIWVARKYWNHQKVDQSNHPNYLKRSVRKERDFVIRLCGYVSARLSRIKKTMMSSFKILLPFLNAQYNSRVNTTIHCLLRH